jgi:hypothetical protein
LRSNSGVRSPGVFSDISEVARAADGLKMLKTYVFRAKFIKKQRFYSNFCLYYTANATATAISISPAFFNFKNVLLQFFIRYLYDFFEQKTLKMGALLQF